MGRGGGYDDVTKEVTGYAPFHPPRPAESIDRKQMLSDGFLRNLNFSLGNLYKFIDIELSIHTKFRYTH